jgi:glycosyltransferase involved in cell wall biosynthesis/2-polyprenyl-3-methyl-5-hydroxy-6-metoxy-1,4-benzoquinol methylase
LNKEQMMEIVIAAGGMPFGPRTHEIKSLGGSEQAAMSVARELKKRGHIITLFAQLPPTSEPDHWESGKVDEAGVRWCDLSGYNQYVENTEHDLLIASRDPRFVACPAQARKKVLWCHDIATHRGMQMALDQMQWTFDELWAVSEWHRQQIHKVTGYPLKNIVALRNGIVPVDVLPNDLGRMPKALLYAARPERGLENLLRAMKHLPDYTLYVAMYAHFPEHMRAYYEMIFAKMKELPNVKYLGGLSQPALREYMQNVEAYVYPTQFEETSCILAREAIERGTPFLTTREGALPETLGECGIFFEDWFHSQDIQPLPPAGSEAWCAKFAEFVKDTLERKPLRGEQGMSAIEVAQYAMTQRADLYWDGVAEMMEANALPTPVNVYSRAWSLVQDGDVIPARALLAERMDYILINHANEDAFENEFAHLNRLYSEIEEFYPFILGADDPAYESLASYYARFYAYKKPELKFSQDIGDETPRYNIFAQWLADLPPGSLVAEYGCGEGHILGNMAKRFPHLRFVGFDHVQQNVEMVNEGARNRRLNIEAYKIESPLDTYRILDQLHGGRAQVVICTEVLEHNVKPWELATEVERMCEKGGMMIFSTPQGPWEPMSFTKSAQDWPWRNHIWSIDKQMLREMFRDKQDAQLLCAADGMTPEHRSLGQNCIRYTADHAPIPSIDPLSKALRHHSRQTCAAALIACNNEQTILHTLHSLNNQVNYVQIALGPSEDNTRSLIEQFAADHPHMPINIINVPKITPATIDPETKEWSQGYGFDDARNASVAGLDVFDWVLWIDTDEYLVGDLRKYLRSNCLDSYMICQHHFTTEPVGAPAQVDRPARLFRARAGFKAIGKVHEHFECPTGGPGRAHLCSDVHIGHTGYKNEKVRRGRFERNFPFLMWDHHVNPERKLHKYLWFRDIIHRMRYYHERQDFLAARALADEAIQYYNENVDILGGFGFGGFQAIQYRNEAFMYLGRGVQLQMQIALDDRSTPIAGLFESYEEAERMVANVLKPEFERRRSKYY